jgi:GrpB-like predicted nucleotidyltransferase (UPF0157 family)
MTESPRDEEPGVERLQPRDVLNAHVYLAPYDPEWPRLFEREAARIRSALGERALLVEHVGSTSIPGLAAKPKIDIDLAVADTADEDAYVPQMDAAGYVLHVREHDWHEHRLFKGPDTDVNLHTFTIGCLEIERMLKFREHLRSDPTDRQLYENAKRELAQRRWKYMQDYADAKTLVVEDIISRSGVTQAQCVRH